MTTYTNNIKFIYSLKALIHSIIKNNYYKH